MRFDLNGIRIENWKNAIREITNYCKQISSDLTLDEVVQLGAEAVSKIASPDLAAVYLVEKDRLVFRGEFSENASFQENSPEIKRVGQCLCGLAAESGNPIFSENIHEDLRCTWKECKKAGLVSVASVPLISRGNTIGVLVVGSIEKRDFEKDADIFNLLAAQLASGLNNARLNEEAAEDKARIARFNRRIKRSKDFLQEVFDGISDPLVLYDRKMTVLRINKAASEYFELKYRDAIGRKCGVDFPKERHLCDDCEIFNPSNRTSEFSFERPSCMDKEKVQKIFVYPLDGQPEKSLVRFHDVTDRKLWERQLVQNEKLTAMGLLASGIAHEIKNPVGLFGINIPILREYVDEMIRMIDDSGDKKRYSKTSGMTLGEIGEDALFILEGLDFGAGKINRIVTLLQDFNRPYRFGKKAWVHPSKIVSRVAMIFRNRLNTDVRTFVLDVPEDLPSVYIESEALDHVLTNLLINAIQALDKPDSRVGLKIYMEDGNPEMLVVEVTDNGEGILEEDLEKIFNPFFTTKKQGVGTGLGLYICRKIMEKIDGDIEVESIPGQGTTMRLRMGASNGGEQREERGGRL